MKVSVHPKSQAASVIDHFYNHGHEPGFMWLDSSMTKGDWGTESLVAWNPVGEYRLTSDSDRSQTERFFRKLDDLEKSPHLTAVGYIGYEAACLWHGLQPCVIDTDRPLAHFWIYDEVHWIDRLHPAELASPPEATIPGDRPSATVRQTVEYDEYLTNIERIKRYLYEGDIYQANLTTRFDVESDLSPQEAYLRLRQFNPAPYSSYLEFGGYRVLSSSPERLLFRQGKQVASTPIKGTIERGADESSDEFNRLQLLQSDKNRAELLMIVDLVRNDLGRVAKAGSVRVEELFRAEAYSSLFHLVGDVSAELRDDASLYDLLRAILPAGSITGAPKLRAIEIINQLEIKPRSVYTGCIGYICGDQADFNVAIRTMIHQDNTYHVHAGGGIVADSNPEEEYSEMRLKAKNMFRTLGLKG